MIKRTLCIDIGNTQSVFGIYKKNQLIKHIRVNSLKEKTKRWWTQELNNITQKLKLSENTDIAISSVVPKLSRVFSSYFKNKTKGSIYLIKSSDPSPIKLKIDQAHKLGTDRLVNAIGAMTHYKTAAIIIDFGTATTIDKISKKAEFVGGIICPGPETALKALSQRASQIPEITIKKPKSLLGKNTFDCLQSGIFYSYLGMIDSLVKRIQNKSRTKAKVIVTGGLAPLFINHFAFKAIHDPVLTLKGIKIMMDLKKSFT